MKVRAYDPRVGDYVETDNPALILGRLMWNHWPRGQFEPEVWDNIEAMANYCDELVPAHNCKKCGGECKVPTTRKHPEG